MMNLEAVNPMASYSARIPLGDAGTEATIARMRGLIDAGVKNPTVHEAAAYIIRASKVPQFDFEAEARAIYLWVLRSVRFTRDIAGKETLHAPDEILRLGIGDCDDFTILLCSLLGTIGHKTRIVTISSMLPDADGEQPFTHVYPEVMIRGRWVPVDAARREAAFGKGPRRFTRKRLWSVYSEEYIDVQGLNYYGGRARRFRNGMGDMFPTVPNTGGGDFNWAQLIPEVTTGTANIITASRANPINLVPTTSQSGFPSGYAMPPGYGAFSSPIGSGMFGGISSSTLLLLGLGVILVMGMRR